MSSEEKDIDPITNENFVPRLKRVCNILIQLDSLFKAYRPHLAELSKNAKKLDREMKEREKRKAEEENEEAVNQTSHQEENQNLNRTKKQAKIDPTANSSEDDASANSAENPLPRSNIRKF